MDLYAALSLSLSLLAALACSISIHIWPIPPCQLFPFFVRCALYACPIRGAFLNETWDKQIRFLFRTILLFVFFSRAHTHTHTPLALYRHESFTNDFFFRRPKVNEREAQNIVRILATLLYSLFYSLHPFTFLLTIQKRAHWRRKARAREKERVSEREEHIWEKRTMHDGYSNNFCIT